MGRQTADAGDPDVLYDLPELSKEGASGSVPAHSEGRHLCRHSMINLRLETNMLLGDIFANIV